LTVGSGDAPYDSDRSLLKVIHDHLLSYNPPSHHPPPVPPRPSPAPKDPRPAPPPPPPRKDLPPPVPPKSQPWDATKSYAVGDIVSYDGKMFKCITAHRAQVDWTPTAAVSLWTEVKQ
jgi:chitinase